MSCVTIEMVIGQLRHKVKESLSQHVESLLYVDGPLSALAAFRSLLIRPTNCILGVPSVAVSNVRFVDLGKCILLTSSPGVMAFLPASVMVRSAGIEPSAARLRHLVMVDCCLAGRGLAWPLRIKC